MMKCVYAYTAPGTTYPSYISVSAEPGSDMLTVHVRHAAKLVETESGSHYDCGDSATTYLTDEQALDLAKDIEKHIASKRGEHVSLDPHGDYGIGPALRQKLFPLDFSGPEHPLHTVLEEEDRVGEVSHIRRIVIDSVEFEPLKDQVARLAQAILSNFDHEPSTNDGAVDVAIRLLKDHAELLKKGVKVIKPAKAYSATSQIVAGLRDGKDRHVVGETACTTLSPEFVAVGTDAMPVLEGITVDSINPISSSVMTLATGPIAPEPDPMQSAATFGGIDVVGPQPTELDDEIPF